MNAWPYQYICLWYEKYRALNLKFNSGGYLVFRRAFDTARCTLEQGAEAHKVAIFVTESEAADYCAYRNSMTKEHGTDDVAKIKHQSRIPSEALE